MSAFAAGSHDAAVAERALADLSRAPIGPTVKGFGGLDEMASGGDIAQRGLRLDAPVFSRPLFVLRTSALEHNIAVLADYCARRGALLAPHAKTTMSPELFLAQLRAGAWALTAANVTQASVFVLHGARRVIIANQVTDRVALASLRRLLDRTAGLEVLCYVDSVHGAELLVDAFAGADRAPQVLVEIGLPDARTGVRDLPTAEAVARVIHDAPTLRVVGTSCFEGSLGEREGDELDLAVDQLLTAVRIAGERLSELGLVEDGLVLSAGGSHLFDRVIDEFSLSSVPDTRIVVRSGSYVTHDHGVYLHDSPALRGVDIEPFIPAIEIRATVLSRPDPDLVLITAGRRDVSFDAGYPVVLSASHDGTPIDAAGATVTGLNDQHGFVTVPATSSLAVGDEVVLGISHPCTTFDKWTHGLLVDDDDVVTGVVHTFF
ncbi:alanine racemase [Amnibacterium flavum]|nr:alanine racemase [Amnibacterium flavum]